jgi:hypothetical protein
LLNRYAKERNMNTQTQTHDTQIFSAMVEILVSSGLGEEDYGFTKNHHQTRYEELASVMNQMGFSNRAGNPLNRKSLIQVVHRVRQKEDLIDELKPDWEKFRETGYTLDTTTDHNATGCLVCGSQTLQNTTTKLNDAGRKLCSSDCVKFYQDHKDAPHDPLFPTIFHQMRYEESLSKINH